MEGTSVCCRQRQETPRTRRWCKTLESTGPSCSSERFGRRAGCRTRSDRMPGGGRSGAERRTRAMRKRRNGRRGAAAAMRYGYRRGTNLRRVCASEGIRDAIRGRFGDRRSTLVKPDEPQVRYRLQHAGNRSPEKTVEVVRNHEDGTRAEAGRRGSEGSAMVREWTEGGDVGGGAHTRGRTRGGAPKGCSCSVREGA
jgi:hypothetical protein